MSTAPRPPGPSPLQDHPAFLAGQRHALATLYLTLLRHQHGPRPPAQRHAILTAPTPTLRRWILDHVARLDPWHRLTRPPPTTSPHEGPAHRSAPAP